MTTKLSVRGTSVAKLIRDCAPSGADVTVRSRARLAGFIEGAEEQRECPRDARGWYVGIDACPRERQRDGRHGDEPDESQAPSEPDAGGIYRSPARVDTHRLRLHMIGSFTP